MNGFYLLAHPAGLLLLCSNDLTIHLLSDAQEGSVIILLGLREVLRSWPLGDTKVLVKVIKVEELNVRQSRSPLQTSRAR